jgi:hypothetical protein
VGIRDFINMESTLEGVALVMLLHKSYEEIGIDTATELFPPGRDERV